MNELLEGFKMVWGDLRFLGFLAAFILPATGVVLFVLALVKGFSR